jgi:hypothetical protein
VRDGAWWWHRTSELLQERVSGVRRRRCPAAAKPVGGGRASEFGVAAPPLILRHPHPVGRTARKVRSARATCTQVVAVTERRSGAWVADDPGSGAVVVVPGRVGVDGSGEVGPGGARDRHRVVQPAGGRYLGEAAHPLPSQTREQMISIRSGAGAPRSAQPRSRVPRALVHVDVGQRRPGVPKHIGDLPGGEALLVEDGGRRLAKTWPSARGSPATIS